MTSNKRPFRHHSIFAVLCLWIAVFLLGMVAFHGCGRVSDEQLAKAVESAMKRSTLRNKAEILDNLMKSTQSLAVQELERLNRAERVYDTKVFFDMIGKWHPMGYGFFFKIKRGFSSYEVVDIRESDSLLHKYEVLLRYDYDVLQTKRWASAFDGARERADKDFDFKKTDEQGSWEFRYWFNTDFKWEGEEPEFIRARGYQVPGYSSSDSAPLPSTRTTKYKTTKGRMPSSLASRRKKQEGSTQPSKKPPAAKRTSDENVRQQSEKSPAGAAEK